jgi:osmotically-inducible protein OsmY
MSYPRPPAAPPEHSPSDPGIAVRSHIRRVLRRAAETARPRADRRGDGLGSAPDTGLRRAILDAMALVPAFDPDRIGVAVADSVVILTGAVDHPDARAAVERGVRGVAAVRGVVNCIRVDPRSRPDCAA